MAVNLPLIPELDYQIVMEALKQYSSPRKALHDLLKKSVLKRIKKGIYVQSGPGIVPYSTNILANMLYGPSYLSYESALSLHGLIPEQVTFYTNATTGKTKIFNTPVGTFTYTHQKPDYFSIGYEHKKLDEKRAFLIACPEKALADKVIKAKGRFSVKKMADYLFENLRIDPGDFINLDPALFKLIAGTGNRESLSFLLKLRMEQG